MDGCLQFSIWVSSKEALLHCGRHVWRVMYVHHEHVGQVRNRVSHACHTSVTRGAGLGIRTLRRLSHNSQCYLIITLIIRIFIV